VHDEKVYRRRGATEGGKGARGGRGDGGGTGNYKGLIFSDDCTF